MGGTMQPPLVLLLLALIVGLVAGFVVEELEGDDYWARRARLLRDEQSITIGGDLKFEGNERAANEVLMDAKRKEIDNGQKVPRDFLPSHSFLLVNKKIRSSPVYKIIQRLPKGSVLHAHDTAITSSEYVYWNVTFRPNLYVCEVEAQLRLRFFDKPDEQCDWRLLDTVRSNETVGRAINNRILKQLTMITKYPGRHYPNGDAAWTKFMDIFIFTEPLLTYKPVFEDYFYQGLLEFYNDNILYVELRSILPTLYDLDGKVYGPLEVARLYKNISDRFVREHPDFVGVKLIYAPLRKCDTPRLEEFVSTARELKRELPDFVAGFDLVGQEDKGEPLIEFAERLRALGDDVQLFFHAGETNWYGTSTDENLIDAVMLNTKRIGHGYALLKHPKVMELVREKKIAIEVCPISNQVLSLVKDLRNHPASVLFAGNYPVVISNDDPGLWGAQGLSYDFYEAFVGIMSRNADLRALKQLALNSIAYSSMSDTEKDRAMKIWNNDWRNFIDELRRELH